MSKEILEACTDFFSKLLPEDADPVPSTEAFLDLLSERSAFVGGLQQSIQYTKAELEAWAEAVEQASEMPGNEGKLSILEKVREDRMLGVGLLILAFPDRIKNGSRRWWNMLFAEQQANGNIHLPNANGVGQEQIWTVKQLPVPDNDHKYLIFSDIHRDSDEDDEGPFQLGSIDHFKANKGLYLQLLEYAESEGYTVIEGGDCEELWFVGKKYPMAGNPPKLSPAGKLQQSITSHDAVYTKLADLHKQGRYVRVQGNHDSYLKDPAVFAVLKTKMESTGGPAFQIYDTCIIDGVKTMMEHSAFDLVMDSFSILTGNGPAAGKMTVGEQLAEQMLAGKLGLNSNDYTAKTRMVICHGHQFDFWNCPENELLGLLISNTVGVPADELMDPLIDVGGIALQGNPFIDFGSMFASLPVFNSWVDQQSSVQFAHDIKHQANSSRLLKDDIFFFETIPAFWGAFGLFLNAGGKTPAQSRQELGLQTVAGMPLGPLDNVREYFSRHAFNHICLGHTHGPHSQPYVNLENASAIMPPLAPVFLALEQRLAAIQEQMKILPTKLKTGYFNSGTAGWMQGVVWAIEIGTTGQARLVYWTENSKGPEYMGWELPPLDGANAVTAAQFEQAVEDFIGKSIDAADQKAGALYDKLKQRIEELKGNAEQFEGWMKESFTIPLDILGAGLLTPGAFLQQTGQRIRSYTLDELKKDTGEGIEKASQTIREELEEKLAPLRDFSLDVFMSVKRREILGFDPGEKEEMIIIKVPYPGDARETLDKLSSLFAPVTSGISNNDEMASSAAQHAAAFAYSIFGDFPNNMPFFSSMDEFSDPAVRARRTSTPILQAFLSTLWIYPQNGSPLNFNNVQLGTTFVIGNNWIELTVILTPAGTPNVA